MKLYGVANLVNSCDEYCGLLSLTKVSGTQYRAKSFFTAAMMAVDVVSLSLTISGNLEK